MYLYFQMGKKQLKDPKEAADMATAEMLRRTHHSRAWYRVIAGRANKGGSKVPFYNKPKVRSFFYPFSTHNFNALAAR